MPVGKNNSKTHANKKVLLGIQGIKKPSDIQAMPLPLFSLFSAQVFHTYCNQNKVERLKRYAPYGSTHNRTGQHIDPLHNL